MLCKHADVPRPVAHNAGILSSALTQEVNVRPVFQNIYGFSIQHYSSSFRYRKVGFFYLQQMTEIY